MCVEQVYNVCTVCVQTIRMSMSVYNQLYSIQSLQFKLGGVSVCVKRVYSVCTNNEDVRVCVQ